MPATRIPEATSERYVAAVIERSGPLPAAVRKPRTLYWVNLDDWLTCPELAKCRLLDALKAQGMELALNPANDQPTWQARLEVQS